MQGIDSYLANQKQRSDALTQSMSKMRLLSQQMRSAVDSVKQYRTPPSILKVWKIEFTYTTLDNECGMLARDFR